MKRRCGVGASDFRKKYFLEVYRIAIPATVNAGFVPPIKIVITDRNGRLVHMEEFADDEYRNLLTSLGTKREANALRRQDQIFFSDSVDPKIRRDRFPLTISFEDRDGEIWRCHFDESGNLTFVE
jgi:hypothetical protein